MAEKLNFLLGYGERLMEPVPFVRGGGEKGLPYTFAQAQARLTKMAATTALEVAKIPREACPKDEVVCMVTLHPEYLARSYYPETFFKEAGLDPVGSKATRLIPERRSLQRDPELADSTIYFAAGSRTNIANLQQRLSRSTDRSPIARDLPKVELLRAMGPTDRIKLLPGDGDEVGLEIVLHASGSPSSAFILEAFETYALSLGMEPVMQKRLFVGGLCFLPVFGERDRVPELAQFSFLRTARALPRLRVLNPEMRSFGGRPSAGALPQQGPLDPNLRVAIFDGGLAPNSPLRPWAEPHDAPGIGASVPDFLEHGHDVTSALLFGSLRAGEALPTPVCHVDHFRVLDANSANDPLELYDVLQRLKAVLQSRHYDFFNLSVAPEYPIEDDDVHPWTAFLDQFLARGHALAAVAVGNGGDRDEESGLARIQVPADCVNALAVGAATTTGDNWERASYSSIGPGRKPGQVKPDLLAFGGSNEEPFYVLDGSNPTRLLSVQGTSPTSRTGEGVGA